MLVVIVTDNGFAAEAIRRSFRGASGVRVAGYVDGRHPCGAAVAEAAPDVVIVDEMTWSANAVARISEVRRAVPAAKIIVLTAQSDADLARRRGPRRRATPRSPRPSQPATLGLLVREIWAGNIHHAFTTAAGRPAPARATTASSPRASWRSSRLVAGGASNGVIARQLWVTEQTVKFHLSNVYRKLGVGQPHGSEPLRPRQRARRTSSRRRRARPTPFRSQRDPQDHEPHGRPTRSMTNAFRARADELGTARPAGRFRSRTTPRRGRRARPGRRPGRRPRQEGDQEALRFLYLRYADNVYGYVASIVRDDYEAEDVTQHVFAKLMTTLPKYEQREVPFAAWILRVARNVAVDHMRQRRAIPCEEVRELRAAARRRPPTSRADAPRGARRRCPTTSARSSSCATSSASAPARSPAGSARPSRRSTDCTTAAAAPCAPC